MNAGPNVSSARRDWLDDYLASLPEREGTIIISSPRPFALDEADYDRQYRLTADDLMEGRGLANLARARGTDISGPALEIGCGTGLLSLGLVESRLYPSVVLTDPSPAFLDITRQKVERTLPDHGRVQYAILLAEDIDRLPVGSLSLIAMRSTLHHVLDVDGFILRASALLRPGGVLAFWEPCADGYILMGALAQFIPVVAAARGHALMPQDLERIDKFVRSMLWYADRRIDKVTAEDKHVFRPDQVLQSADRAGLSGEFLPNHSFGNFAHTPFEMPRLQGFGWYMFDYLEKAMQFPPELVSYARDVFLPYCEILDELTRSHCGPYLTGVFFCRKRSG